MSSLGLLPEEKTRKMHGRRVSEETVYSVHSSSNGFSSGQRRVVGGGTNFLPRRTDTIGFKTGNSYVAQRVLSAKVLRFKELQNELQEAKNQLHEVMNENKLLRNLQKRQDTALSRYEDSSAALPRLLENHRAEVNTLKTHAREVRAAARSLHRKLQRSEAALLNLREQHEKLQKIAEDKDLDGRSQLQKRIEELEDRLNEMKEKNIALSRKMEIEQKSHSQQLSTEVSKRKMLNKELQAALNEVTRLTFIIEEKQLNRNGGGDNELQSTSSKLRIRKSDSQKIQPLSKKYGSNIKVSKSEVKSKSKIDEIIEKDKDESNEDFHIPLQTKSSDESLNSNPTLAQTIVSGLELTTNEYLNKNNENTELPCDKNQQEPQKKCDSENENHISNGLSTQISSNGENYSWYDEPYSEKSKIDFSTTPSRTSCDVNDSKSSAQSERQPATSSYIPRDIENELSDSSEEEEKIKLTIKKERYRPMNRKPQSNNNTRDLNYNDVETESDVNQKDRPSRYKSMKNNLNKIQDHLNKFDDNVDEYIEEKSLRNKNSPYADIMEKGVQKHGNFDDYIKKLEEIDRLNDNLIATNEQQNQNDKSDDELYQKNDDFFKTEPQRDVKDTNNIENRKSRRKNVNISEMDLKPVESDKFLDEINTSYKLIRSRMDAENVIMNQKLQQYCNDVADDVQAANDAIDRQKQHLERNRRETEVIERAVRTNTKITEQLKFGGRIDSSKKTQLLAALKAIDCGKNVDEIKKTSPSSDSTTEMMESSSTNLNSSRRMNKKQIMKELFE